MTEEPEMPTATDVLEQIRRAFGDNEYPGDPWIQGSHEGCEPGEAVAPFVGRQHWQDLDASTLDEHYAALSFFSEAGFRFFLPAFLVADVRDELETADPLSHLVGGFSDGAVEVPVGSQVFTRRFGSSVLMNPRRYGAIRFEDHARLRLSVFTREESQAIVSYLEYKHEHATIGLIARQIEAALESFWRGRAADAPPSASLRAHLEEDASFLAALRSQRNGETPEEER